MKRSGDGQLSAQGSGKVPRAHTHTLLPTLYLRYPNTAPRIISPPEWPREYTLGDYKKKMPVFGVVQGRSGCAVVEAPPSVGCQQNQSSTINALWYTPRRPLQGSKCRSSGGEERMRRRRAVSGFQQLPCEQNQLLPARRFPKHREPG